MKRILSYIMVLTMLFCSIPFTSVTALSAYQSYDCIYDDTPLGAVSNDDILTGLDKLRVKFPDGKYWNHYGSPTATPDKWTDMPCPDGHSTNMCNGQCVGFARKLGYDLFGSSVDSWTKRTNLDDLCVGDYLLFYDAGYQHAVIVVGFTKDTDVIRVADCNWDRHCGISWDRDLSLSKYIFDKGRSYYILHNSSHNFGRTEYLQSMQPSLSLNKAKIENLNINDTADITAKTIGTSYVEWTSSNSDIAAVSYGYSSSTATITARGSGTAAITATIYGNEYSDKICKAVCTVTVKNPTVSLDDTYTVPVGYTLDIDALTTNCKNLDWAVTDTSIASVSYTPNSSNNYYSATVPIDDFSAAVTANKVGTTTLKAYANSTCYDICTIKVTDYMGIERIHGKSRIDTALEIAKTGWDSGTENVILTNAYQFADALAGVPLSKAVDAPILLTANEPAGIESSILNGLSALDCTTVYILGGANAVNAKAESDLTHAGYTVIRLAGQTRFETAVRIAEELNNITNKTSPDTNANSENEIVTLGAVQNSGTSHEKTEVFLSSGAAFPDALAISPVAAIKSSPVLYISRDGSIDSATKKYLTENAGNVVIVGGSGAISSNLEQNLASIGITNVERISGSGRFETCMEICTRYQSLFTYSAISLATGYSYPDALAGGAFAAKFGMPVILSGTKPLPAGTEEFLSIYSPERLFVFGGTKALNDKYVFEYTK